MCNIIIQLLGINLADTKRMRKLISCLLQQLFIFVYGLGFFQIQRNIFLVLRPLSFLGMLGVIFIFLSHFSMKFLEANRIAPEVTPRFLGLFYLHMSHKRDARLK